MTRSRALLLVLLLAACGREEPGATAAGGPEGTVGQAGQASRPPALAAADLPPPRSRVWQVDELPQLLGPVLPEVDAAGQVELARRTAEGDDWETEKLHARSSPVLRGFLDALLSGDADLTPFLARPFEGTTDLRPKALQQVFQSGSLRVLEPGPGSDEPRELGDATTLAAEFAGLRAALGDAGAPRAEPIVVGVEPTGEGRFQTRVLLQLDGESAEGPVQVNTEWTLGWALDEGGTPRLSALRRTRYQEVRAAAPLFVEATEAVFGAAPFWRSEFLRGVDD